MQLSTPAVSRNSATFTARENIASRVSGLVPRRRPARHALGAPLAVAAGVFAQAPLHSPLHSLMRTCGRDAGDAKIIDGKLIAETIRKEVADGVAKMKSETGKARGGRAPHRALLRSNCRLDNLAIRERCKKRLLSALGSGRPARERSLSFAQVPGLAVVLVGSRKVGH